MFLKTSLMDAIRRQVPKLRTRSRVHAQTIHDNLISSLEFMQSMDDTACIQVIGLVGASNLFPSLYRFMSNKGMYNVTRRHCQTVSFKTVAMYMGNWIVQIPFSRGAIPTPETFTPSLNMLVRVSNVCIILLNLWLLLCEMDEASGPESSLEGCPSPTCRKKSFQDAGASQSKRRRAMDGRGNDDKDSEEKEEQRKKRAEILLDIGLEHCMYEWDENFLRDVFVGNEEQGFGMDRWETSAGLYAHVLRMQNTNKEASSAMNSTSEFYLTGCDNIVKILMGKMVGGMDEFVGDVQTVDNNEVLKRIDAVSPGLVHILVDKHMGVLSNWFGIHMRVHWPFYLTCMIGAVN
jgi:hypothetical protein